VSAADDKDYVPDDPRWAGGHWGNRSGNEGRVGPPAKIFRVLREDPKPPVPPPDAERVFATPADYHSRSFYTYRWRPAAHLKTHIFRALDDAVFRVDWSQRPRPALTGSHLQFFPDAAAEPQWDADKRQQVANELNQLNRLSRDAAGTAQAMAYFRGLSNDGLRVLAGLPGNERAFSQLTIQPLDPANPANANRRGPDNRDSFLVDPALRAYVDTLDGRSTNRYFYRAAYTDGAHNRSRLSLSSPPVWLPDIIPPRAPVITKVLGGNRQITLRWASNREPNLVEYRVYRAASQEATRDLRLMTLVHTEPLPPSDPAVRPGEVTWTNHSVSGSVTMYYRVVAVDDAGNVSVPSNLLVGRAYDYSPPTPPVWLPATRNPNGGTVTLAWSTIAPLRTLVQRREQDNAWQSVSSWLPPFVTSYADVTAISGVVYMYRLRVQSIAGILNTDFDELEVLP
jgi:hypothetical protein